MQVPRVFTGSETGVFLLCWRRRYGNLAGMKKSFVLGVPALLLLLSGCQTTQQRQAAVAEPETPPVPKIELPFEEPEVVAQELDEDLVFSYLVGEIGARTGELRMALVHYLHAAMLARDAYAAERATRIALHLKDFDQGLRASRRWVELAPNSLTARQLSGVLLLRQGEQDAALRQFRAAVRIADALGKDGLLQVATVLNAEQNRAAALQLMRDLTGDYPHKANAHYALAVLEVAQQRFAEAEASLRKAIEVKPEWALPRVMLSRTLAAMGRNAQGMRHLALAVEAYPDNRLLRLSYARMLVGEQDYDQALQQFRELYQRDPNDQESRYAYAMLSTQQSVWGEARSLWQELRNDPKFRDEATYFLGQVEELDGNPVKAIGLYRSVDKGDFRVDAVIRAASLMADQGQLTEARESLADARITEPERAEDLYVSETQLLQSAGAAPDVVLRLYDTALLAHPDSNALLYNRGLYFADLGRFQEMEADFKAVLARDNDHAEALNALGYVLADRGVRLDEALTYILRAHKLKPDNAAILDSLGWAYYRKGEFTLALKYLRQAVSNGEDDEISAHLGEVLWVSGEQDEAQSVWRSALEAAPESPHLRAVMERFLQQ